MGVCVCGGGGAREGGQGTVSVCVCVGGGVREGGQGTVSDP